MKVKKLMTTDAGYCSAEENLTKAVEIMWQRDCGAVPVVDGEMKPVGMITDRDIAIAASSKNRKPSQIKITEIISNKIFTCLETDDAEEALRKMRRAKIKRLPVVGEDGALVGVISITDLILKAPKLKKKVFSTVKAIGKPHAIVLREVAEENLSTDKHR
jgi:CBS domain-containing protein